MNTILEHLTQNLFLKSLIIGIFSSITLSLLGIFVVLKRAIFITLAIAELAVLGLVAGIIISFNAYLSMILVTFLGLCLFSFYKKDKNFSEDSLVGIVYAVSFSLSVLLLSKTNFFETYILDVLSGNILIVKNWDLIFSIFIFLVSIVFFILFNRQLFFMYSDTHTSYVFGINYKILNFIFFIIVGLNIIFFLRSIGLILSFSYLVIPCSFALISSPNIKQLIYKNLIISVVSTILGLIFSFIIDLPSTPTIVVFLFIFGILFSRVFKS